MFLLDEDNNNPPINLDMVFYLKKGFFTNQQREEFFTIEFHSQNNSFVSWAFGTEKSRDKKFTEIIDVKRQRSLR